MRSHGLGILLSLVGACSPAAPDVQLSMIWEPEAQLTVLVETPDDPGFAGFDYAWSVDGEPVRSFQSSVVEGDFLQYGQTWQVNVTARWRSGAVSAPGTASLELASTPTLSAILTPLTPVTTHDLDAVVLVSDGFLQPPIYRLVWTVDGVVRPELAEVTHIPADQTQRGQLWRVDVVAVDPWYADTFGAEVTIANAPPVADPIVVFPSVITTDTMVAAKVTSTDPDNDVIQENYRWTVDGVFVFESPWHWLDGRLYFQRGQQVTVDMTASDGELVVAQSASFVVENTLPGAPVVSIQPAAPTTAEPLSCQIDVPAFDADGDPITNSVTWTVNGVVFTATDPDGRVPASLLSPGDVWTCTVVASDDVGPGGTGVASARVSWRYSQFSAGGDHTCAVRQDGAVLCVGSDADGESTVPARLGTTTEVAAGLGHTCALSAAGAVTCWGRDESGQAAAPERPFVHLVAGAWHTCGIDTDSRVACWGLDAGQLSAPDEPFTQLAAGAWHTCGITAGSELRCWGDGSVRQLDVPDGPGWVAIAAGDWHTCAVDLAGAVACWGWTDDGQGAAPDAVYTGVGLGQRVSCGVQEDGLTTCWGTSAWGLDAPPAGRMVELDGGEDHVCARTDGGRIVCWGDGSRGQTRAFP
jgi:hypothetical protein